MTRHLAIPLALAALVLFAVGAGTSLVSAAALARVDAMSKPSIQSCTGQPHVDPQR